MVERRERGGFCASTHHASAHTFLVFFYQQACKKNGVYVDGHRVACTYIGPKGIKIGPGYWCLKGTAPPPAEPAEIPAEPGKWAGGRALLTLAGLGVVVRVKRYNPKWDAWVVTYQCASDEDSEMDLIINMKEGRLKLLGESGVGSVMWGVLGVRFASFFID